MTGAAGCVAAHHPIVLVEKIKFDAAQLGAWLEALDYNVFDAGSNFLTVHKADKCLAHIKVEPAAQPLRA